MSDYPKSLVLSFSGIGSANATGALLALLFRDWPGDRLLQLYYGHHPRQGVRGINLAEVSAEQALETCAEYEPEIIYFRPVDTHPEYWRCALTIIRALDAPLVTHIMDDWPARLTASSSSRTLLGELQYILNRSARRLTICPEMSAAYAERYAMPFENLANGIDLGRWNQSAPQRDPTAPFTLRYAGALADDMQRQSIGDIAQATGRLCQTGKSLRFEIYTMPWFRDVADALAEQPGVSAHDLVPLSEYPRLLATADAVVLAYNFDPASIEYTRLSFANKTPECLASGKPVLAYGPRVVPSIDYVARHDLGTVVDTRSLEALQHTIAELAGAPESFQTVAERAKRFAFEHHDADKVRRAFKHIMHQAKRPLKTFTRQDDVNLDETQVIFGYFRNAGSGVMIDVGAHHGSAFAPFLRAGWVVHGFEPDPENRKFITDRMQESPNLIINPEAVGSRSGESLPFYASEQSTGISSLIPFHDGHKQVATIQTITLSDYCKASAIDDITFLKIDTEGYDLRVLEGLDWEVRPAVIECEFEDAKTTKIGYTFEDLANFLLEREYTVFVSEWHPIVRYGIRHQWHALRRYPCKLDDPESWGNLIAFRDPIDDAKIERLFLDELAKRNPDSVPVAVTEKKAKSLSAPPPTRGPSMNPLVNHLRILKRFLAGRPGQVTVAAGLVIVAINALAPLLDSLAPPLLTRSLALVASFIVTVYLVAYLRERTLFDATNVGPAENLAALNGRLTKLKMQVQRQGSDHTGLSASVSELRQQLIALEEQLGAVEVASEKLIDTNAKALRSEIDSHAEDLLELHQRHVDLKAKLPAIVQMINNLRNESAGAR